MAEKKKNIRKRETFGIQFTKLELVHLRDLFNVQLPNQMTSTVSQHIALIEQRQLVETKLWAKIVKKLQAAEIPTDEAAPDFTLGLASSPDISVFRLDDGGRHESYGQEEQETDE